jgi:uncharacterized membrane protein
MDRYSKFLLTIIAIALVWIGFKDVSVISNAMASSGAIEVKVVELVVPSYRPIPVKIEGKLECK